MDVWLIKVDENGDETWNKTFGGSLNETGNSVNQTTDGGYILAGFTESYGNGGRDVWIIRTDENGNELWSKTFGGANNDLAQFIQPTSDDGFIITGSTQSFGNGGEDMWLIKIDANGNEMWNKTYGGSLGERAYTVYQTSDSGYVLAGRTESYGNGNLDAWLIKTDKSGNEIWNKTFGGSAADNAYSLQITLDEGYISRIY
jgi:predicted secreted protein